MQAIQTKFLGPTNFRGSRIKATCGAGSAIVEWDHSLDPHENHILAAYHLAVNKLEWTNWLTNWLKMENIVSGFLSDGSMVHVLKG
jgi:hypothetical protein